jgi:predicted lipoprotein with Yx(FWY)xxD motif
MFRIRFIVAIAALGFGLAACASNSSAGYGGATSTSSSSGAGAMAAATVGTAKVGDLGTVLVNGDGRTLYIFGNDTGSTSTCVGSCAGTGPALTTSGEATASAGATASMLGTTTRDDGTTQVTYNGHPLYLYSGDTAAGQANGEGIGNVWYASSAQGTAAMAGTGGGSRGNGGGGGYGSGGGYG